MFKQKKKKNATHSTQWIISSREKIVKVSNVFFQIPDIHSLRNIFESLSCADRGNNICNPFPRVDYIPEWRNRK